MLSTLPFVVLSALQLGTLPATASPLSNFTTTISEDGTHEAYKIVTTVDHLPASSVQGLPKKYTNTTTALLASQTSNVAVLLFTELPVLTVTAQVLSDVPPAPSTAAAQSSSTTSSALDLPFVPLPVPVSIPEIKPPIGPPPIPRPLPNPVPAPKTNPTPTELPKNPTPTESPKQKSTPKSPWQRIVQKLKNFLRKFKKTPAVKEAPKPGVKINPNELKGPPPNRVLPPKDDPASKGILKKEPAVKEAPKPKPASKPKPRPRPAPKAQPPVEYPPLRGVKPLGLTTAEWVKQLETEIGTNRPDIYEEPNIFQKFKNHFKDPLKDEDWGELLPPRTRVERLIYKIKGLEAKYEFIHDFDHYKKQSPEEKARLRKLAKQWSEEEQAREDYYEKTYGKHVYGPDTQDSDSGDSQEEHPTQATPTLTPNPITQVPATQTLPNLAWTTFLTRTVIGDSGANELIHELGPGPEFIAFQKTAAPVMSQAAERSFATILAKESAVLGEYNSQVASVHSVEAQSASASRASEISKSHKAEAALATATSVAQLKQAGVKMTEKESHDWRWRYLPVCHSINIEWEAHRHVGIRNVPALTLEEMWAVGHKEVPANTPKKDLLKVTGQILKKHLLKCDASAGGISDFHDLSWNYDGTGNGDGTGNISK